MTNLLVEYLSQFKHMAVCVTLLADELVELMSLVIRAGKNLSNPGSSFACRSECMGNGNIGLIALTNILLSKTVKY